jgi:hypothetical protein
MLPESRRRNLAALDLGLQAIDAMAIDSSERLLAVGQYHYPHQGVALIDLQASRSPPARGSASPRSSRLADLEARAKRWQCDWQYSTYHELHSLAFTSDGARLWLALGDGSLRCHSVEDGRLLKETAPVSGDSIDKVRLSRDARYAVVEGSDDLNRTGWSGGVTQYQSFSVVVAADGPKEIADEPSLVRDVTNASPGRSTLLRFRDSATLAYSRDGSLELVSRLKGHESAPLLILQERAGAALDEIRFRRTADFALAAVFSERAFWVGTQSGLIFAWSVTESA